MQSIYLKISDSQRAFTLDRSHNWLLNLLFTIYMFSRTLEYIINISRTRAPQIIQNVLTWRIYKMHQKLSTFVYTYMCRYLYIYIYMYMYVCMYSPLTVPIFHFVLRIFRQMCCDVSLVCYWCVVDVLLPCYWCVIDVFLMCYWCVFNVLLWCCCCAIMVLLLYYCGVIVCVIVVLL